MAIFATLCYVFRGKRVLLLLKSKGLFGEGKWNAPGGKLLRRECPDAAAVREVFEETGLRIRGLRFHGVLNFHLGASRKLDQVVFVFSSKEAKGKLRNGVEGRLRWFPEHELPYDRMWEDDRVWLPVLLKGGSFVGSIYFSNGYRNLEDYVLEEAENSRPIE